MTSDSEGASEVVLEPEASLEQVRQVHVQNWVNAIDEQPFAEPLETRVSAKCLPFSIVCP